MYKIQSKIFLLSYFLAVLSPIFTLSISDRALAQPETPFYTSDFTPPNNGQSSGNGTKKSIRTAANARGEALPSYTLNFTPPNKGEVAGSGTKKPKRTAARSLGNLKAIVPQVATDPVLQRPIYKGYTANSHPVFWLTYNSKERSQEPIEISIEIKDSQSNGQNYLYRDNLTKSDNSQAKIAVELPQNAPPLVTGTEYQWRFIASKDGKIVGEANGYIEKVDLPNEAIEQLNTADLTKKAEIYAQLGVWHELLNTLNQLQQDNPNDSRFENAWNNLLAESLYLSSN